LIPWSVHCLLGLTRLGHSCRSLSCSLSSSCLSLMTLISCNTTCTLTPANIVFCHYGPTVFTVVALVVDSEQNTGGIPAARAHASARRGTHKGVRFCSLSSGTTRGTLQEGLGFVLFACFQTSSHHDMSYSGCQTLSNRSRSCCSALFLVPGIVLRCSWNP
jgi:hypothetical protein